jgi:hypothetical protein
MSITSSWDISVLNWSLNKTTEYPSSDSFQSRFTKQIQSKRYLIDTISLLLKVFVTGFLTRRGQCDDAR